ncbi:MAG: gamma carbonic anhydrase family protein [Oscillospiraceae bacterium]|nr:gamma carbonic anhydrase family protein [Oscillospiraceae bacterium]
MQLSYNGKNPAIGRGCFVAETAAVIGDVTIGEDSSVWYGAAVRGDYEPITIGCRTNIQDNATIHNDMGNPVVIGDDVSVGHNAVVHGATLENGVLVGMGAVVLDKAVVGEGSLIAAGAVVTKGTVIPPNSLVIGIPAKVVKTLSPGTNLQNAANYVSRTKQYLQDRA